MRFRKLLRISFSQKLDEEIAHCKDQLQELKARTGLISKYVKKQSEVCEIKTAL